MTIDRQRLPATLRKNAIDPGDRLCIDLLDAEGYWFTRPDFIDAAITVTDGASVFDPVEAINFAHRNFIATPGQRAFLDLALAFALLFEVSLFDTLPHLDGHQLTLILNAVVRHAGCTTPITIDGSLPARLPLDLEPLS